MGYWSHSYCRHTKSNSITQHLSCYTRLSYRQVSHPSLYSSFSLVTPFLFSCSSPIHLCYHPLSLYSSCTRVFQIFDNFSFVKTFAQVTSFSALTLSNAELISLVVDSANVQMNLFHVEQFSWAYGSNKYTYVTFLSLLSLISSLIYPFTIFFSSSFFFAGKLQQASLQEEFHTW